MNRRTTRRVRKRGPLASSYGVVIIPKGTLFYHYSHELLDSLPSKPALHMRIHPSEGFYNSDGYVSVVEIQKNIRLFFMVNGIKNLNIYSALSSLLNKAGSNRNLADNSNLEILLSRLQTEGMDGWFSSIRNNDQLEIGIRLHPSILKLVHCSPIQCTWTITSISDDFTIIPKKWGFVYPISCEINPCRFILNCRFQSMIETYRQQVQEEDPRGTTFSIILENADISYFDAPIQKINWS